eukprot:31264-Pelagococcus_subviridis.AAC.3
MINTLHLQPNARSLPLTLLLVRALAHLRVLQDPHVERRHLHELVVRDVLDAVVQRQRLGLVQNHRRVLVRPHVRRRLPLRDVHLEISVPLVNPHDLAFVHVEAGLDEHDPALLGREERVRRRLPSLERDERAVFAHRDVAAVREVSVEDSVQHRGAARRGEDRVAQAEEAARRDLVLHRRDALVVREEVEHLALAVAHQLDARAVVILANLDRRLLERLELRALLVLLHDHLRRADAKLEPLAAHVFDENRDVKRAATADDEGVRGVSGLNLQREVPLELAVEPVLDVPRRHELALLARERRRVHAERHPHRGFLDGDRRKRLGAARHDRLADHHVGQTRHRADVARANAVHDLLLEVFVDEHLADLPVPVRSVRDAQGDVLLVADGAGVDAAERDAPLELVVVQVRHEHLQRRVDVHDRRGDVIDDHVEQRLERLRHLIRLRAGDALKPGRVDDGKLALLVARAERAEQVERRVHDPVRARAIAIDLVDDDAHLLVQRERLLEDESRLRHRPLYTSERRGGVERRQLALKGADGGD